MGRRHGQGETVLLMAVAKTGDVHHPNQMAIHMIAHGRGRAAPDFCHREQVLGAVYLRWAVECDRGADGVGAAAQLAPVVARA